ncbi:signal peptide containing protein [Babesia caballi]|uniref:Signal peptide containing protein n=1 Tax=Babesia caballi TaxID=5871 RepID=A0AAV4LV15_BABCB|nr:signal peptide containing protein [Babesia caballi]
MAVVSIWVLLAALCLTGTLAAGPPAERADEAVKFDARTYHMLSGDHAGIAIRVDLAATADQHGYVQAYQVARDGTHKRYVYKVQPGFAATELADGDQELWRCEYMHVDDITVDVFDDAKYATVVEYVAEKPNVIKYFVQRHGEWFEMDKSVYVREMFDLLKWDTLNLAYSKMELSKSFISRPFGKWQAISGGFKPKFGHVLRKVMFGKRTLWEYNPETQAVCIRADKVSSGGVVLVVLHFLELNESYGVAIMYGKGNRTMKLKKYYRILRSLDAFQPEDVPNLKLTFDVKQPEPQKEEEDASDVDSGADEKPKSIIPITEDGGVDALLSGRQSTLKVLTCDDLQQDSQAVFKNVTGTVSWDLFDSQNNPDITSDYVVDKTTDIRRYIYSPKKGYYFKSVEQQGHKIFTASDSVPYMIVKDHVERTALLDVYTVYINGRVQHRYFLRRSGQWSETSKSGLFRNRSSGMRHTGIDIDDMEPAKKYLTNNKDTRHWMLKHVLPEPEEDGTVDVSPVFNVYIRRVHYSDVDLWEYKKSGLQILRNLQRWSDDGQEVLSITAVNHEDLVVERMFTLNGERWDLVREGAFITLHKKPVTVHLTRWRNEGIVKTNEGARTSFMPILAYYIDRVLYGDTLLYSLATSDFYCGGAYVIKLRGFAAVSLKLYDRAGQTYYKYYVNDGVNADWVEVDVVMFAFLERHLDSSAAFVALLRKHKFTSSEFFDTILVDERACELVALAGAETAEDGPAPSPVAGGPAVGKEVPQRSCGLVCPS